MRAPLATQQIRSNFWRAALVAAVACASPPPAESPSTSSAPTTAPATASASATAPASATETAAPTATAAASAAPAASAVAVPTGGSVLIGEIPGSKKFNPKQSIEDRKVAMVDCYNKARASKPDLSGKLKLLILVNAAGAVIKVDAEPGGTANDPTLIACIGEAFKMAPFPKPGGMATVVAPLVFRP